MTTKFRFQFLSILTILSMLITIPQPVLADGATLNVPGTYATIQEAVDAAAPGDTIQVAAGTYAIPSVINLNKANLTLSGAGSGSTILQVSGTGERFYITAPGVTITGFGIQKTDKVGVQNIIYIGANDVSITNNEIWGQFVIGEGDVSRAMVFTGGLSGLNISGNTIHDLRQPGYISGVTTGTISNNYVYLTKGWVVEQGNMTFTNNTWGTGANANVYDIAILGTTGAGYYTDIPALAATNNGAFIEDQRASPATLSIVYVDGSVSVSGDGTARSPKKTITEGVTRVVAGGTVHVAAGTYVENLVVGKPLTLAGAGQGNTIIQPAVSNPNPCTGSSLCGGAASNVIFVQANNVIIHDLTVDGDNPALTSGIVRTGSGSPADLDARNGIIKNTDATYNDLEVFNVTTQNIYLRGIYSTGGSFNFHHNTVTNVQGDAYSIAMFAWIGPGTMANNTVSFANDGIAANWSNGIQFINNTVTQSGTGVHTDNAGSGVGAVADLIQGNTISNCKTDGYGIFVFVPYIGPTVDGNTITNCTVGLSAWGQANPVTTQFTNNIVSGPANAVGSVGAYITTDQIGYSYNDVSVLFTGNTITGFETGVYLTADAQSWTPGWLSKTITATFHTNQIFGNTTGADKGTTGTYVSDFARNWWGAASGPSGVGPGTGDSIADGMGFAPWCTNAACTTFSATFPPPVLPSSFYGEIHFVDGAPSAGDLVEAYLPGISGAVATAAITTYEGNLVYSLNVPGVIENEGEVITFKINGRVAGTGIWHSGTTAGLNLHPPQALPGGPYSGTAGTAISFAASANDWGNDVVTYQWDWDNNGTFDETGQNLTHTWADSGSYTVGLQVTDAQGGVGSATVGVTVNPISATITLSDLNQTYDGTPKPVTVTTTPAGLAYSVTYDGLPTVPTNADDYVVEATITAPNYAGSASGTLTIAKADTLTVVSGGGTFVYDGAAHAATVSVTGAGGLSLNPSPVYSGSCAAAPVNVSDTPCTASYTYAGDLNHNTSSGSTIIVITTKPITVTANAGQSKVFGAADPVFAYTSDALIGTDSFTGALSREPGENVGTYAITQGTLSAGNNYSINFVPANFSITSASATITLSGLGQTYDGTPKPVTVTTSPVGLPVSVTYDGSAIAPTNAGSYAVVATITDPNYSGTASGTLVISQAAATVTLSGLSHVYDGTPKSATVTTSPAGLTVDVTYNGGSTAPTDPGSYTVVATVNETNYAGSATGTLVILAKHTVTLVPGWNLVSFNVHPTDTNIASVLASVNGNFDLVYVWDGTGAHSGSGNWLKYDNIPASPDSLTTLTEGMGFWIRMTAADVLEVTGSIPTTTSITLSDNAGGWNLVGYPSAANGQLPTVLSGNGVSLVYAYHANDTGDPWKLYDPFIPPVFNDLTQLSSGWGYWIKVTGDHTWVVTYAP